MIPQTMFNPVQMQQQPSVEGNRLAPNMTHMDLGDLMPVSGRGGLNIQFFYMKTLISSANPERNGTWQTRLCIAKMPKGDRLTVSTRFITEDQAAREFPREWAMFKQYESVPTDGTPLEELPGMSQSQIAMLVIHNLRCIEDLAELSSEVANTMGLDVISAHRLAKRWIARRTDENGVIAAARADAHDEAEKAALMRRLDAAEKSNAELAAMVKILQNGITIAPQAQVQAGPQGNATAIAVDRADDPPPIDEDDETFLEGGMVTDDDDPLNMRGSGNSE